MLYPPGLANAVPFLKPFFPKFSLICVSTLLLPSLIKKNVLLCSLLFLLLLLARVGGSAERSTEAPKMGLGDLLRKELNGKKFLSMEPHHERLRKRIVSKKGNINIGKTKVSQRWVVWAALLGLGLDRPHPVWAWGSAFSIRYYFRLLFFTPGLKFAFLRTSLQAAPFPVRFLHDNAGHAMAVCPPNILLRLCGFLVRLRSSLVGDHLLPWRSGGRTSSGKTGLLRLPNNIDFSQLNFSAYLNSVFSLFFHAGGERMDTMRCEYKQLCVCVPLQVIQSLPPPPPLSAQSRDPAHNRLRWPYDHRGVSRGHLCPHLPGRSCKQQLHPLCDASNMCSHFVLQATTADTLCCKQHVQSLCAASNNCTHTWSCKKINKHVKVQII